MISVGKHDKKLTNYLIINDINVKKKIEKRPTWKNGITAMYFEY